MSKACKKCGAPLPLQEGPGRRRVMCAMCAPVRDRGKGAASPRPLKPVPTPAATTKPEPKRLPVAGLVDATKRELADADATDTSVGQAALLLAECIEFGDDRRSTGLASMVKQHRECMAQVFAGKPEAVSDPLDELRKRRASRGS